MDFNSWLLYFTITIVATASPGPGVMLAFTHGLRYGAKRTIATALGYVACTILMAIISAVGLGALLLASEAAFQTLKILGGIYLIYLGIRIWRSNTILLQNTFRSKDSGKVPLYKLFMQSFLVGAGNPKTIAFFVALFPQFINSKKPILLQFAILSGTEATCSFISLMSYALLAHRVRHWLDLPSISTLFNKITGSIFIGFGVTLATSKR